MSEIEQLLPHRAPFLFVDELTRADAEGVEGVRTFSEEDFFFKGHFPEYPVVPGVILVESMAQCGGAGLKKAKILDADGLFFLASIEKAKFRRQVVPGDIVRFEVVNERTVGRMIKQKGKAFVGDELAAEASWMCVMGEKS